MKIRAITIGVEPGRPLNVRQIAAAGAFAQQLKTRYEEAGVPVQTVRLATPPFPTYLSDATHEAVLRFARDLEHCSREHGIDYCALGPVNPGVEAEKRFLDGLPALIAGTEAVFVSACLGKGHQLVHREALRAVARVVQQIARITSEGFGNLRFAAVVNCPPAVPFFPVAFHEGAPAFSLALQAADIVALVCTPDKEMDELGLALRQELETRLLPIQRIAQREAEYGFVFRGIDLSPAPGPAPEESIAYAIEQLGVGRFGEPGTLAAAACITAALQETSLQTCGYCGLMLPVLEDAGLAERNEQGVLQVSNLLAYSAVCGTGLDTIPLPGDVSEAQLTALLFDVAALGWRLRKPLSARLLPVPGKRAGEYTQFTFPYFVNTKVMAIR
jgi:hypothetical protein